MPVEVEVDASFSSAPKAILVGLAETFDRLHSIRRERFVGESGDA